MNGDASMRRFASLPRHRQQQFVDHFLNDDDAQMRDFANALQRWMTENPKPE